MPSISDNEYRCRLIARVEALRKEAGIPMLRFRQQIGPTAARDWTSFVTACDEDTWHHFSLKAIERIGKLFGVGAELLSFRS